MTMIMKMTVGLMTDERMTLSFDSVKPHEQRTMSDKKLHMHANALAGKIYHYQKVNDSC